MTVPGQLLSFADNQYLTDYFTFMLRRSGGTWAWPLICWHW